MIDYGLFMQFMMIYKPSKLKYRSVNIDRYIILYGIIFHEYHYIRISVLTDPPCWDYHAMRLVKLV